MKLIEKYPALCDSYKWGKTKPSVCQEIFKVIDKKLGENISFVASENFNGLEIGIYRCKISGIRYSLVPGGSFNFGLSEKEEQQASKYVEEMELDCSIMQPVKTFHVNPILVSIHPITEKQITSLIEIDDTVRLYDPIEGEVAFTVSRKEAIRVMDITKMTIVSEIEWEYLCRATTKTLFNSGDKLNSDVEECFSLFTFDDSEECKSCSNLFGLCGFGVGEWCLDNYTDSYDLHNSGDFVFKDDSEEYVVRGGAAALYPWQGCD